MKVLKVADSYTPRDLAKYLLERAGDGGWTATPTAAESFVRSYSRLMRAYKNNNCLLVYITNELLRGGYIHTVGLSDKLLTTAVFDIEIRKLGGIDQEWRYHYFRRFAASSREAEYFGHWFGLLTDAVEAPSHAPALVGDEDYGTWEAVITHARLKLEEAIIVMKKRLERSGSLEEWPGYADKRVITSSILKGRTNRPQWRGSKHATTSDG